MSNLELPRRSLLRAASLTALSYSRVLGANSRLQLGVIGCGVRGPFVMGHFQKTGQVDVRVLCDVWQRQIEKTKADAPGADGCADYHRVLERKDIDAVLIASPDHWHARMAIDAMDAGKDAYVEKPLTSRREQGPPVIEAARRTGRICQVGAQQRSGPHYLRAKQDYLTSGRLGKIRIVRTWWSDPGGAHRVPEGMQTKPADLDWKLFLGDLPQREWAPAQYFHFRGFLEYSGGVLADKFVHWIDTVHMFMEQDGPVAANASGGVYVHKENGRTAPDTINLVLEYPREWLVTYDNIPIAGAGKDGIEFCGDNGHLRINRTKSEFFPAERGAPPIVVNAETDLTADHVKNFLDCCRSRRQPEEDARAGHRSAQAAHLGNISYQNRRRIHFDPEREIELPA